MVLFGQAFRKHWWKWPTDRPTKSKWAHKETDRAMEEKKVWTAEKLHKYQPWSPSIGKQGEMRTGDKSLLLHELEPHSTAPEATPHCTGKIFDGAVIVQMLGVQTGYSILCRMTKEWQRAKSINALHLLILDWKSLIGYLIIPLILPLPVALTNPVPVLYKVDHDENVHGNQICI